MPAARTPAATIPEELQRISDRINEQLDCLEGILNTTSQHLEEMSGIMKDYKPEVANQIDLLKSSVDIYKSSVRGIYGQISGGLASYSSALLFNLDDLTSSVRTVTEAVDALRA